MQKSFIEMASQMYHQKQVPTAWSSADGSTSVQAAKSGHANSGLLVGNPASARKNPNGKYK